VFGKHTGELSAQCIGIWWFTVEVEITWSSIETVETSLHQVILWRQI